MKSFKIFMTSVGTNRLGAERHRQEVRKHCETEEQIAGLGNL